ncbi:MAG: PQQ-binding-like beta-propeller repeat protein, partial [Terriglobia bacterium]
MQEATSTAWVTLLCDAGRTGGYGQWPKGANLQLLWQLRLRDSIHSSPVLADGLLYVTSLDGALHAIDIHTGREVWKFQTDAQIHSTPSISGDRILFGNDSGKVFAVDRKSGKGIWEAAAGAEVWASPVTWSGTVFF